MQVIVGSLDTYHRVADSLRSYWADFIKQAKLKVRDHCRHMPWSNAGAVPRRRLCTLRVPMRLEQRIGC